MSHPELLPSGVAVVAALVAAVTDVRRFRIRNVLTIPLLVSGLVFHTASGGLDGAVFAVLGTVPGAVLLLPLHLVGGMGAGDVKLAVALGAWVGPVAMLEATAVGCGLAAAASVVLTIRKALAGRPAADGGLRRAEGGRGAGPRVEDVVAGPNRRSRVVPFGPALAFGLLLSLGLSYGLG